MDKINETKDRQEILELVRVYAKKYHKKSTTRIPYAAKIYDEEEMVNLIDSSLEFWLTAGRYTQKFEKLFADYLKVKYCSFVNSGSSANLLAFMALTSPLLGERAIEKGDEVITVAAGFPTTVAPCIQYGAIPVFVDITIPQYNIDVSKLENALSKRTKAVMVAHTLGNPFDLKAVKEFCDRHNLWLIEDNCDALGSEYMYDDKKVLTGSIGDIGTSSFYPPHHITTGEGGMVYTNNALLNKIICSMRDWGRECICPPGQDNMCGKRFSQEYDMLPKGYDHKYVYSHFGYNLKATDMQAAIGCAQMDKLPEFIRMRRKNFSRLYELLKDQEDKLILPQKSKEANPSWFGFIITCKESVDRDQVVSHLEAKGIQTRMLFAGNLLYHPCFDKMRQLNIGFRVIGKLSNTDQVLNKSFWVGVYPGLSDEKLVYIAKTIKEAINK